MNLNIDMSGFDAEFNKEMQRIRQSVKDNLIRVGEKYIDTAKDKGNYRDQTGNLRSANGYAIIENGSVVKSNTGRPETLRWIEQQAINSDIECVMGNGMSYASKLEGKGYDVTSSGIIAAENEARKLFK